MTGFVTNCDRANKAIRDGTVRVAAGPGLAPGVDIASARWLPDRTRLIAGAVTGPYLVDSATLAAGPLRAAAGRGGGPDVNCTLAILPPRS